MATMQRNRSNGGSGCSGEFASTLPEPGGLLLKQTGFEQPLSKPATQGGGIVGCFLSPALAVQYGQLGGQGRVGRHHTEQPVQNNRRSAFKIRQTLRSARARRPPKQADVPEQIDVVLIRKPEGWSGHGNRFAVRGLGPDGSWWLNPPRYDG